MAKSIQRASVTVALSDGADIKFEVEGMNTANIRSKLKEALDTVLIGYPTVAGAIITINIERAETDEFADPDR